MNFTFESLLIARDLERDPGNSSESLETLERKARHAPSARILTRRHDHCQRYKEHIDSGIPILRYGLSVAGCKCLAALTAIPADLTAFPEHLPFRAQALDLA